MKPVTKLNCFKVASLLGVALEVAFLIGFYISQSSVFHGLGIDELSKFVLVAFLTFHAPAAFVMQMCGVIATRGCVCKCGRMSSAIPPYVSSYRS